MPRVQTNNIELEYEEMGEGEPLLLIMGLNSQLIQWPTPFCEQLAEQGFRVIRFDHRDSGLSSKFLSAGKPDVRRLIMRSLIRLKVRAPYTLYDMAADASGLLEALEIESAHVLGISMGGMIAQCLAIRQPERVRSLTSLMSTTGDFFPSRPRALRALLKPMRPTREGLGNRYVEVFNAFRGPRFEFDEQSIRELGHQVFERDHTSGCFHRHMAAILATGSRSKALKKLKVPTLVLHGTHDPLIPPAAGRATAKAVPGARLHMIEGMGHELPEGAWPEIIEAMLSHSRGASLAEELR